ncbi:MAG: hypothetical protein PWQ93_371 [Clostridiales bacterium]|nr:hypothetical protein [Clostridiales bacterium]
MKGVIKKMSDKNIRPKIIRVMTLAYWAAAMRGEVPETVSVRQLRKWLAERPMLAGEDSEQIDELASDVYTYMADTIIE